MDKLKAILKDVFFKKAIVVTILTVVLVTVLLSSFVYFITLDDGTYKEGSKSNVPYTVASEYITNVKFGTNGIYFEETDEDGTTREVTAEEIWDNLIKSGSTIRNYLSKPEELEKLMNAEVITQYPKIEGLSDDKLNGTIEFERHLSDGSVVKLKYVNLETFNNYITNQDITNSLKYFTLDESGNVLIGVVDKTTEEISTNDGDADISNYSEEMTEPGKREKYTVSSKPIPYKNTISKYTMPFQYLWSLLVVGDDKDFVLELADLVQDSEIVISIYDTITTTVNTQIDTYKKQRKVETQVITTVVSEKNGSETTTSYSENEYIDSTEYNVIRKMTYENNTPLVDLTKADVWIVDFSKEYKKVDPETSTQTNETILEDTEYVEDSNSPQTSYSNSSSGNSEDGENQTQIYTTTTTWSYTRQVSRNSKGITDITTEKYIEGNVINNPKVEKEEGQVNFVTLLCKWEHREAKKKMTSEITSWLFEILENNPDTINMVDLTKYLFYKVTGRNFGVTEFDFSEYSKNDFSSISFSGNILMEYLASWENTGVWQYVNGKTKYNNYIAKYITQDKQQYICYVDSNLATRNFGYGVCHTGDNGNTYWHVSEYAENGIDIASGKYDSIGVSKLDVSIVDDVKVKLLNGYQSSIKKQLEKEGITDLTQEQLDSLTCIMYQYGNIGNFAKVYKKYGNTDKLISEAKSKSGKTYFNSNVESNGRSQANWRLFHEGIYQAGTGEILDPNSFIGGGDFLETARSVWKVVCTSGRYTRYGGSSKIPVAGPSIDCSAFVSWVLYEYGYKEEFNYQHDTSTLYNTNWNAKFGWEEISVGASENPVSKLRPGDILVRVGNGTHHATIVAEITSSGRLLSYDCGNSNASWNGTNGDPVDKTYFLTVNAPGKIIRVKPAK